MCIVSCLCFLYFGCISNPASKAVNVAACFIPPGGSKTPGICGCLILQHCRVDSHAPLDSRYYASDFMVTGNGKELAGVGVGVFIHSYCNGQYSPRRRYLILAASYGLCSAILFRNDCLVFNTRVFQESKVGRKLCLWR